MSGDGVDPEERLGEDLLTLFEQAAEVASNLISDNDELRRQIGEVVGRTAKRTLDPASDRQHLAELRAAVRTLESERRNLREQVEKAEGQNRGSAERCVNAEGAYHDLVSLYVATHQLHSTVDLPEVLRTVQEIVINLIGAEVFVIYLLDRKARALSPVAAEGAGLASFPPVELGAGIVGRAVESGETTRYDPSPGGGPASRPIICVPLGKGRRAVGAIVIYRFLRQKDDITPLDRELFDLLAAHAATAISTARFYSLSERKLTTMQGFLDLLAS